MIETTFFDEGNKPTQNEKIEIIDFLYTHLENFGDSKADIEKAINYAVIDSPSPGGFLLKYLENNQIVSAVVINRTGMSGYIPENILVYIATHCDFRGKGIGKKVMKLAIEWVDGNIALHVEADNPAKHLYEKLGFTNKYLEMRLSK
jgi:ribosomal protein S18 acetylase RimI-like enzyme